MKDIKQNKILRILLVLFGLVQSSAVLATEYTVNDYAELRSALNTVQDGDIIILNNNIPVSENLGNINKNITIDGKNQYGLYTTTGSLSGFVVATGKNVTLKNMGQATVDLDTGEITYVQHSGLQGFKKSGYSALRNNGSLTLDNVIFYGNNGDGGHGKAIYNSSGSTVISVKGKFLNNTNGVGALANYGTIEYIEADFIKNSGGTHGGAILNNNGGRILEIRNSNFIANSSTRSGGAIRNLEGNGNEVTIYDSLFRFNSSIQGGAIKNGNSASDLLVVNGSTFDRNYSVHDTQTSASLPGGGAINSSGGDIHITDSQFINNVAAHNGGAILSQGPLYINAKETNIEFKNNKSGATISNAGVNATVTGGVYNDLYLLNDASISANTGKIITFNGSVVNGDNEVIISLNNDADIKGGNYTFNNEVSGGTFSLYNGANIKLGSYEQEDGTTSYGVLSNVTLQNDAIAGGAIDFQNNHTDEHLLKALTLASDINIKIDADLANGISDYFAASSYTGIGKLNITGINILSDSSVEVTTKISNSVLKNAINLSINEVDSATTSYALLYDNTQSDGGYLKFSTGSTGNTNLVIVNRANDSQRIYSLAADENIATDIAQIGDSSTSIGAMGGSSGAIFTINGNSNYSIIGENYGGITVNTGKTLNVNNVGSLDENGNIVAAWKGFKGTLFTINNGGTVNFAGENVIAENATDNKQSLIFNNGGTVTTSEGKLNILNNNYNASLINNTDGTIDKFATLIKGNLVKVSLEKFYGGIIYNNADAGKVAKINELSGEISDNEINNTKTHEYGGIIYNYAKGDAEIDTVSAIIKSNQIKTNSGMYGAIIRNEAENGKVTIGKVSGDIKDNTITFNNDGYGVLISNKGNKKSAEIGSISGNIENNIINMNSNKTLYGGISNEGNDGGTATIGSITSDISNNKFSGVNNILQGGIIYNYAKSAGTTIETISGNISKNQFNFKTAEGAIIENKAENGYIATIEAISGKIEENIVLATNTINGGIIYNKSRINSLSGRIANNYVESKNNTINGGIIFNDATGNILITSDITNNYTKVSISNGSMGGIIFNTGEMTLADSLVKENATNMGSTISNKGTLNILADNKNVIFSGNQTNSNVSRDETTGDVSVTGGDAIDIQNRTGATLNLFAKTGKTITFDGEVRDDSSTTAYAGGIYDDNGTEKKYDGSVIFNNTVALATLNIQNNGNVILGVKDSKYGLLNLTNLKNDTENGLINTLNNHIESHQVGKTTLNSALNIMIDMNVADNLTTSADTFALSANSNGTFNITGLNMYGEGAANFRAATQSQEITQKVLDNANSNTRLTLSDAVKSSYEEAIADELVEGRDEITGTTVKYNDKFGDYEFTRSRTAEITVVGSASGLADAIKWAITVTDTEKTYKDDVLHLINIASGANRTFDFDGTTNTYTATQNTGTTSTGKLTILGTKNGNTYSTIDANSHSLFDITTEGAAVEIRNTEIKNAAYVADVASGNTLTLNNAVIDSSNVLGISNAGTLNLISSTINKDITGAGSTVVGVGTTTLNSINLTQNNLTVTGDLVANGSPESYAITVNNSGGVANGSSITSNNFILGNNATFRNDGAIISTFLNISAGAEFTNINQLQTNGRGTNDGTINGNGTFINYGVFQNNGIINQEVENYGQITSDASNLKDRVIQHGHLYLTGGTTQADIFHGTQYNKTFITGSVTVGTTIKENVISLEEGGTLNLLTTADIDEAYSLILNKGNLNFQKETTTNAFNLGNVDIQEATGESIDVNLTGDSAVKSADNISATSVSGSEKIYINHLNIVTPNMGDTDPNYAKVANNVLKDYVDLGSNTKTHVDKITQNGFMITYGKDLAGENTGGFLEFAYADLVTAARATTKSRVYVMGSSDEDIVSQLVEDGGTGITDSNHAFGGVSLTVNGNGTQAVIGGGTTAGIQLAGTQTLSLNDIKEYKGFSTGIINYGTVNITNVAFKNNTTDIENNSQLNLYGEDTFAKITGNGTTNIKGYRDENNDWVNGNITLSADASIAQKQIIIEEHGQLTGDVGSITTTDGVIVSGILNLIGTGENTNAISGAGTTVISGNQTTSGVISSNVELRGTLTTSANKLSINDKSLIGKGGTLDLRGNTTETLNIGALDLSSGNLNIKIDADLANATADMIDGNTVNNNIGKAIIKEINLLSDSAYKYIETKVAGVNLKDLVELASADLVINHSAVSGNYTVSYSSKNDGGYLTFNNTLLNNLVIAARESGEVIYNMGQNEDIATDLAQIPDSESNGIGNQVASKYTVNGNGYEIDGSEKAGITVTAGQEINYNNVKKVDNFAGDAVTNSGKMIINANSTNSTFGTKGSIKNNNALELTAATGKEINILGTISNGDTDSGITTVNGLGTVNISNTIKQKGLVVTSGVLNIAADNLLIADGVTNESTINLGSGELNSSISGTNGRVNVKGTVNNSSSISQKSILIDTTGQLTGDVGSITTTDGVIVSGILNLIGTGENTNAISGAGTTVISGNQTTSGIISSNVEISGTLATSANKLSINDKSLIGKGGTLDLRGNTTETLNIGALDLSSGNLNIKIDADLANATADMIDGNTVNNNIGKAIIKEINLLSDSAYKYIETKVAGVNLKDLVELASTDLVINHSAVSGNYTVSYSSKNDGGYLTFNNTLLNNLVIAARESGEVVYNMGQNEDIATDLAQIPDSESNGIGNQVASKYTINGNGYEIDGAEKAGITVTTGQEINYNNVKKVDNFAGDAVTNSGKMIINANSTNSTFGTKGSIKNNNALELTAATGKEINILGTISNGDTDSGITTVNGLGTVNISNTIKQKELVVTSGVLNIAADNLLIADGVTNESTINLGSGELNSSISGTNGSINVKGTVNNGSSISQNSILIDTTGQLTGDVGSITTTDGVIVSGILNLIGTGENTNAISGAGTTVISGNQTTSGVISSNVELRGTLTTSANKLSINDKSLIGKGGTLDLRGNTTETLNIGALDLSSGNLNIKIDAELANATADMINVTSISGNNKLVISALNLLSDAESDLPISVAIIEVTDTAVANMLTTNVELQNAPITMNGIKPDHSYLVTYAAKNLVGELTFSYANLVTAIVLEADQKAYTMVGEEKIEAEKTLKGDSLSIAGNGNAITGDGNNGIRMAENQTLGINEVNSVNGFDTAITNDGGTVNVSDTVFANNNVDIKNNGELNLEGENTLNSGIKADDGKGTTNIKSGTTILNGESVQNEVVVGNEEGNATTFNNKGTLTVGSLENKGGATVNNNGNIIAESINNNENGVITSSADGLTASNGVINDGVLNLTGGTNTNTINGYGETNFSGESTNNGKIKQKIVNNSGTFTNNSDIEADTVNEGTLQNTENAVISDLNNKENATVNNSGAIASVDNSGAVDNSGKIDSLTNQEKGIVDNSGEIATVDNSGAVDNSGKIDNLTNREKGTVDNSGEIATVDNSGAVDNSGKINSLTNREKGTVDNSGEIATVDNSGAVDNSGKIDSLTNREKGTVDNSGEIATVDNSGVVDNSGIISAALNNNLSATVNNTGSINAVVNNAGTINNEKELIAKENSTNKGKIAGNGTLTIEGTLDNTGDNSSIIQKQIVVAENGELTSNNDNVSADITNNGIFNMIGGDNNNKIDGAGTVNISSDMKLNQQIGGTNTVNVSSGTLTFADNNALGTGVKVNANKGSTIDLETNRLKVNEMTFKNGSTLKLRVNSLSDFGSILANTINVESGANLHATLAQGLIENGKPVRMQLLTAQNSNFNNFADHFNNNMYSFEKDGKNGAYIISLTNKAEDIAKDENASNDIVSAAKAWVDGGKFTTLESQDIADKLADLAQSDGKGFVKALKGIVPDDAPIIKAMTVEHSNFLSDTLKTHIYNRAKEQKGMGLSSGDELLKLDASVWVKTYAGHSSIDASGDSNKFNINRQGVVLGIDKKVNSKLLVGVGYGSDTTTAKSNNHKDIIHSNSVLAYTQYKNNDYFINGLLAYTDADYEETKQSVKVIKAKYDTSDLFINISNGYDYNWMSTIVATPELGVRYHYIERDGYRDTADQKVSGNHLHVLTPAVGTKISTEFNVDENKIFREATIKPEVYVGIGYDFISDKDNSFVRLNNGESYILHGSKQDQLFIETRAGAKASFTDNVDVGLWYLGNYRGDYRSHAGMVELKVRF